MNNKEILLKLKLPEGKIINQDNRLVKQDKDINIIFRALKQLLNPRIKKRKRIGFKQ